MNGERDDEVPAWVRSIPLAALGVMILVDAVVLLFVAGEPRYLPALVPISLALVAALPVRPRAGAHE